MNPIVSYIYKKAQSYKLNNLKKIENELRCCGLR